MTYPSLEQYNEALQHPRLSLLDSSLQQGSIKLTGMGTPLALCGGFALTYTMTVGSDKFALRCFHKQSLDLEKRYFEISKKIQSLNSSYFLHFEFQNNGVRVGGKTYPLVKMAWAKGVTLGEFLEQHSNSKDKISNLLQSLRSLANFIETNGIAHGDISPDNLMVSNDGKTIQLIDYDGMYVPSFQGMKSSELGNRNFQHIKRSSSNFNAKIDRFSFILLFVAMQALLVKPNLWLSTQSEATAVIFRANDFAAPASSQIFKELSAEPALVDLINKFANVSTGSFDSIPSLDDFLSKASVSTISFTAQPATVANKYYSTYPIVDATDYNSGLSNVGNVVEMIGQITEVKQAFARNRKPYVFINFGNWKGNIIKIAIWSEALDLLQQKPDQSWIGRWVSVTGLMDPPYSSQQYKYTHLSVTIAKNNQMTFLTESQAKFRLAGSNQLVVNSGNNRSLIGNQSQNTNQPIKQAVQTTSSGQVSNRDLLNSLKNNNTTTPANSTRRPVVPTNVLYTNRSQSQQNYNTNQPSASYTPNQGKNSAILNQIQQQARQNTAKQSSGCFISTEIYGLDSPQTNKFRAWRDNTLQKTVYGRLFIKFYYRVSPYIVYLIRASKLLRLFFEKLLAYMQSVIP